MTLEKKFWQATGVLTVVWLLHLYFDADFKRCFATFLAALCTLIPAFGLMIARDVNRK